MNMSRREFFGLHDSSDSGFNSHTENSSGSFDVPPSSAAARMRGRNLEMILNGRHKFEVRDLERLTSEPVVNLALPKLPNVFHANNYQPAPIGGLVRPHQQQHINTNNLNNNNNNVTSTNDEIRRDSLNSIDTTESTEEEKLMRDNNSSEKSMKAHAPTSSQGSKNSSPGSSRHSWCNAGEAMAPKENGINSISCSSDETSRAKKHAVLDEEDDSSVTIATSNLISKNFL